jgi:hypothetical protein
MSVPLRLKLKDISAIIKPNIKIHLEEKNSKQDREERLKEYLFRLATPQLFVSVAEENPARWV